MVMFDINVNTIHVDMDGVVADFDAFVLKHMGRTFEHSSGPGADSEMWDFLQTVDRLYYKLPATSYAKELWDFVNSIGCQVKILTAIPRRTTMPTAEQDKRDWVREYLDPNAYVAIGPYSRDKWKHAKPGDILIDDRPDNIADWITKGNGFGILHDLNDVKSTIDRVRLLVA
jgi:hypothetical protein